MNNSAHYEQLKTNKHTNNEAHLLPGYSFEDCQVLSISIHFALVTVRVGD